MFGSIASCVNLTSNVPFSVGIVWDSAKAGIINNGISSNPNRIFTDLLSKS